MTSRGAAMLLAGVWCSVSLAAAESDTEWPAWGNDPGGSRYSPLDQITPDNVDELEIAWTYRTGDLGEDMPSGHRMAVEATPILVDGVLYLSTPYGQVHAVDAASGEGIWRFDVRLPRDRHYSENTSRGVSYWRDPEASADALCARRIFAGTLDGRLIALDAPTGAPCLGFGQDGQVDLNEGVRPYRPGGYGVTSPPAVWRDRVIVGSAIGDNRAVNVELGIVRGFDARTGELIWSWDPIPRSPDNPVYREWSESGARDTGAANAWSVLSVDPALGLVYVPVGSASPDFYGGERPGDNRHANSLVALEAATGEVAWARQLVHHDVWDFDVPAQPVLMELTRDGESVPAVVQITKMGLVFVFDRRTGEPLFDVEERPVPRGGVPGETLSPTQPFPALPPLVENGPLTPEDAWGLTFWDRGKCADLIGAYRSEGIYTPPSLQGTIMWPAYTGGGNWGSVSVAPEREWVITNVMHVAAVVQLIEREQFETVRDSGQYPESEFTAQRGTPYGMRRELLLSPLGVPCTAPPWSTLVALDLEHGRIAWQVPLGTTRDLAPWPFWYIDGAPAIGGSIVTGGGLVFIGAAADDYLRAFHLATGEELWRGRLPAGGQATPMTYRLNGRQYVVISAGGHGGLGSTRGDYVVAFALP